MDNKKASYFFDLKTFRHAELFDSQEFVWQALQRLEVYLAELPLGKIEAEIPDGAVLVNPQRISIGKGTVVESGAYIQGPCHIGEHCTIRQGAYIRGNLITGDKCVIGHATEVKHAIMLNGSQAAHFAYIGDSILGNRVNLGAGVKCANLKLDHQSIRIRFGDVLIKTDLRKLGAIIGDDSQVGCNAVLNPGTFLGMHVFCYPNINLGGVVPSYSLVKTDVRLIIKERQFQQKPHEP